MSIEKISVIGTGYVGLTLAAILAEKNFQVYGIDKNTDLIGKLNNCEPHFYEKGLSLLLRKNINKNLFFRKEIPDDSDAIILCVGTPVDEKTKKPILDYIISSAWEIKEKLDDKSLVVLRSTVPLGATRQIVKPILDKSGKNYALAFCPERTIEGKALEELEELPQIIGGIDERSIDLAFDLFKKVTPTIVKMSSLESAEMVKLLCNSFRDIKFAYANEIALSCEKLDLDAHEIIKAANKGYERSQIPLPGFVGGSCLVKDPYILSDGLNKAGYSPRLINRGREVNEEVINYVCRKIQEEISPNEKIFISGMAFKGVPETNDLRDSPTVELVKKMKEQGYNNIYVHDFVVSPDEMKKEGYNPVSLEEGFKDAKCVLIATNNPRYSYLDIDKYLDSMNKHSLFFDIWRSFDSEIIERNDIKYKGLGK